RARHHQGAAYRRRARRRPRDQSDPGGRPDSRRRGAGSRDALMEEYIPGCTETLHDYLISTFGDVPEIECILVEDREPLGPYGDKGIGEPALIPTAPAILAGIRHATGVRIRRVPATPDSVCAALLEQRRREP